jgi:hypothetical protein
MAVGKRGAQAPAYTVPDCDRRADMRCRPTDRHPLGLERHRLKAMPPDFRHPRVGVNPVSSALFEQAKALDPRLREDDGLKEPPFP